MASRDHLLQRLAQWKALGRRVVLTNGCFDLLHAGHVSLLTEAARLGDVLVVGLNTDESVRQLKGPDRPVRHWEDRSSLLAALECVDVVVPLFESTAHELIREVRPDVYVKGGDYRRDELVEIDLLDELKIPVHLASLVPGVSTSGLALRLRVSVAFSCSASSSASTGATTNDPEKRRRWCKEKQKFQ